MNFSFPLRPSLRPFLRTCLLALTWGLILSPSIGFAARPLDSYRVGKYKIGGDFTLSDHHGGKTRLSQLRGRVVLISFGFTHCIDTCPVTVSRMKTALKRLKGKASAAKMVFITVDPKRDTPEVLKAYLANFDRNILGLTGSEGEIQDVAKRYMAAFQKQHGKPAEGYLVGHTTFYYLLTRKGEVRYIFPHDTSLDTIMEGLHKLIAGAA